MHIGKTIAEAPVQYISFLKQRGIVESKPALAAAVAQHERDHPPIPSSSQPTFQSSDPAQYRLDFGKHINKKLAEVPSSYIDWIKTTSLITDNVALCLAVAHHDRLNRQVSAPNKRKRQTDAGNPGSGRGSGRRKYPRVTMW
jgi:uncharacterized protein (DUF3820 family)